MRAGAGPDQAEAASVEASVGFWGETRMASCCSKANLGEVRRVDVQ